MKKYTSTLLLTLIVVIYPLVTKAQNIMLATAEPSKVRMVMSLNEKRLERALDSYQRGLHHSIPEIVESSMFNLLVLKIDYPDTDFTNALKKLDDLSVYGSSSVVRYKAHVTSEFIKNPTLFLEVDPLEFNQYMNLEKADHFYLALSRVLQNKLTTLYN